MGPPPTTISPPHPHPHPPLPTPKLRLMCSYNGHIIPRPHTNTLCYSGGETRIVAVDRRTTASTIYALTHHLSCTLYNNRPFHLKYQLPYEDLDSLVSVTTDEDLFNMLDEHDRIVSSHAPSRIRLFLFPTRPEFPGSLLLDPKSESWFSDALKSSMISNTGGSGMGNTDGSGMGNTDGSGMGMGNGLMGMECLLNSGDSGKCCGGGGGDSGSVPESMVLETCSSFGSINSAVSGSNLNTIGVGGEKVAAFGLVESDDLARVYHDQVIPEPKSIIYNPSSTVQMQRNLQVSGYQIPHIADQRQQPVQYIQTASPHYVQYPTGQHVPVSSYYPAYIPYQQQPNQHYPIYVIPVGPTDQSYSISAPTHVANSHYKAVMVSQPPVERAVVEPQPTPSNSIPAQSAQPVSSTATPTDSYEKTYESAYDNDLAYAQIYKSQPSVPAFPPQKFETVKKAEPVSLSDNSEQ